MSELQVVLVDDHEALRKGLELVLRNAGMRVTGSTDSAATARRMIEARRPDVAVIDVNLNGEDGVQLALGVLEDEPDLGVLLYTGVLEEDRLRRALGGGVRGFALKAGSPTELAAAIRLVAEGKDYVDPRLAKMLDGREAAAMKLLTGRERQILDLLADGLHGDEVGERLGLSPQTVQTHVRNLMRKLGARSRVHALALALRHREIDL